MTPGTDKQKGIGSEAFKENIANQRPDVSYFLCDGSFFLRWEGRGWEGEGEGEGREYWFWDEGLTFGW